MSTSEFPRMEFGKTSVEVPKLTMLDSIKHLINNIDQEVRRKEWAIETNNRELVEGKDKTIEELHQEIVELEKILDLIPDVKYVKEQNELPRLYRRDNPLEIARDWIKKQLNQDKGNSGPTTVVKTDFDDLQREHNSLVEEIKHLKKYNVNLSVKLSNVENNQLETSIIFLPNRNGKLVPLKKQVELGKVSSGTLLNTVINIPNGYKLDKVILSKE